MRKETKDSSVLLVQALGEGEWAVRWDFKPKLNEHREETGVNWYEEEIFFHIPELDEIKEAITNWQNRQTDAAILHGFRWQDMMVWLSMENQFNYKSVFDLATMTGQAIAAWDAEHPDLAGHEFIHRDVTTEDATTLTVPVPTGRPREVLPVTFKFGTDEEPQYHEFTTLEELTEFYTSCMSYIQGCYQSGWQKKDNFDYVPYEEAIRLVL